VEIGVVIGVLEGVEFALALAHAGNEIAQPLHVRITRAQCRKLGRDALEPMAQFENVIDRRWMALQQMHQRIGDDRSGHVGDVIAATAPCMQQAPALEDQQGLPQ